MDKWICTICGYIYDPIEGDPDNGVDPGTAWEDVPNDWLCPVCGHLEFKTPPTKCPVCGTPGSKYEQYSAQV